MRLRTKDGRWFETTAAIRVVDKLWYTRRGNWVNQPFAEPVVIDEREAVALILKDGRWFEDCPGFAHLPQDAKDRLETFLDEKYFPAEEV